MLISLLMVFQVDVAIDRPDGVIQSEMQAFRLLAFVNFETP